MGTTFSSWILVVSTIFVALLVVFSFLTSKRNSYPPGPVGLPLAGNVLDMPNTERWRIFSGWANAFGDVIYLSVFGKPFVVLSSSKSALDLLEKRSAIYSDRPHLVMAGDLCGMERIAPLIRYGQPLREQRRMMQRVLSQPAVQQYEYIQIRQVNGMVQKILTEPLRFASHIQRMAGSTVLEIIYGCQVIESDNDNLEKLADEAMRVSTRAGTTIWAVDFFPILRYLPQWFPGAGFIKLSKKWRKIMEDSAEIPFNRTKNAMESDNCQPSLVSRMLRTYADGPVDMAEEERIKWTANSLYIAGSDTTAAVVTTFCLAMALHPRVQSKAQEEIDTIIGVNRLPVLADRESLPYVRAVVDECLRWHVPVPITPPRELMKDDEYRGWRIPKATMCLANIWAMLRDASIYPNPEDYYPERFEPNVDEKASRIRDPSTYIFGFGRRRCPGIYLAENSIWLSVATLLASVTIKNALDSNGKQIIPEVRFSSGGIRHPVSFDCQFEPRVNASNL